MFLYKFDGDSSTLTPSFAETNDYQVNWMAVKRRTDTPLESTIIEDINGNKQKLCSGISGSDWINYSTDSSYVNKAIYIDVDIEHCGFETDPLVVTTLTGTGDHWRHTGISSIYRGFNIKIYH